LIWDAHTVNTQSPFHENEKGGGEMEIEARVIELESRLHAVENRISELEQENENISERVEENCIDIHAILKLLRKLFPQETL